MCRLRSGEARAAQRRARPDLALSVHALSADRFQLPSCSNLFGLWRRSDRALRIMGRRMDDAGAADAMPAMGRLGSGLRAQPQPHDCALVFAVALRALARCQRQAGVNVLEVAAISLVFTTLFCVRHLTIGSWK